MCGLFLKKHGQNVKLHVWERWNTLIHRTVLNSNQISEMGRACGTCLCERNYVQGPWYEYLKESDRLCTQTHTHTHTHFIKWVWKKCLAFTWTEFSRLKIGTSSRLWRKLWWTLRFHKMWGMHWLTKEIFGPWDRLRYVVLVGNIVGLIDITWKDKRIDK